VRYSLVVFAVLFLVACFPTIDPQTGLISSEPTRVVNVAVNSNLPDAAKLYVTQTGPIDRKTRSGPWSKSYNRPLKFADNLTVLDSDLRIGASPINKRYTVTPPSVTLPRGVNSISQYFTITDILPQLTADCRSFDQQGKRGIVSALNAYDVAINSPKFLAPSKLAEGKALVDDLFLQYPSRTDSLLFKELKKLRVIGDVISTGIDSSLGVGGDVDFLKSVCGL